MNKAYILLGGNLGDRLQNLELAAKMMEERVGLTAKKSEIYVTKAWGKTEQPDFYNRVVTSETALNAEELLSVLLQIENEMGRVRTEKWAARSIDLDILFYNEAIIHSAQLQIPHPHLQDRRFVLVPLAEIAADLIHPVFQKTVQELLLYCKDELEVRKLTANEKQ